MFGRLKVLALTAALAASCFGASGAEAAGWIIGLVDGKSIVIIDPATRKVMSKADVKSAGPLLGIDVRPADGMLYGVASDGIIVTIDPKSGQATMKSKMSETLKPGVGASVDFNPVADRLRVMGSDGTSLRVNVDDGKATVDGSHKYNDGDANAGKTPKDVAGAFDVDLRRHLAGRRVDDHDRLAVDEPDNPTCRLGAARAEARCGKRPREGEHFELSKHDVAPLKKIRVCRSGKVSAPTPGATQASWRGCRRWEDFLWVTVT